METNMIKFLSLTGLQAYDEKIKAFVEAKIVDGDANSFKYVDLVDGILKFYTVNPINGAEPAFEIELPETDISHLMELVENATAGNVAMFDENGQVKDSELAVTDIATKEEVNAVAEDVEDLASKVQALEEGTYDDSELRDMIGANTEAIATLNGDEETDGSVAKAIADNEIFVTDILTVNALGGISANADLNGMTTHEILTTLLYPYVAQVVDTPSRTPNSTTLEKGNDQTITAVSVKVTKKSKDITSVALYNGSTLIAEKTGDEVAKGGTFTFSGLSVAVPSTSVVLTVKVTDASGNVVSKNTAGWNFVYPYYIGVCAEDAEINEDLVEGLTKKIETKGNKSNTFDCDYQRMVFAYPKSHGALKSVLDPNNFEILGSFTRYEVSVTGLDGTAQTYYVYVNGASTVSSFTVNFKY